MATIYKRGGSYRVQFYQKGKARQKQFKTRKEARTFAERVGTKTIPILSAATVEDLARQYIKACTVGRDGHPPLEPATIELYQGYIDNWILPSVGKLKIASVTPSVVRDFRDDIIKEDAVARSTVKKIVGTFKSVLAHAVLTEEIAVNPGAGITIRMSRRREKRIEVPEIETVQGILDHALKLSTATDLRTRIAWERYYPLVRVLATTGVRLSEARGLSRAALHEDGAALRIFQRADKFGNIGPVKSAAANRVVYLDKETQEAIQRFIGTHNHDILFPSKTGNILDTHNIGERMWRRLLIDLGIAGDITIHHLRHFYASRLISLGESVKEVSVALGHEDEAFTLRVYGHLFQDRDNIERRKQRAQNLLSPPTTQA